MTDATTLAQPSTRRTLIDVLKRRGEARADELAEALGVTISATRQHLQALEAASLVEHRGIQGATGRPKHVYRLAPAAESLFPKAYDELANELLRYVEEDDPVLVRRAFERRGERRLALALERLEGKTFEGRVAELAKLLDEQGYLAAFERLDDGTYRLTEHNCAILAVARRFDWPCTSEIEFLKEALPGADVRRVAHMLGGQHLCAYRIAPPA